VGARTEGCSPGPQVRLPDAGRPHVGPLLRQGALCRRRAGEHRGLHPLPDPPDHRRGIPVRVRDGRERPVLAGRHGRVRGGHHLRLHQRPEGHRLDQPGTGHHHGPGGLVPRADHRRPLLRRGGTHVPGDQGQGPGVPDPAGRRGHGLGRLLDCHPRERARLHHVAAHLHEVLRGGQREDHQEDRDHLPALRLPPGSDPDHRVRGHPGVPRQPALEPGRRPPRA
jgi:hypothetical protein